LLSKKLDFTTRKDWELEVAKADSESMPSLEALLEFLANRSHTLELVEGTKNKLEHVRVSRRHKKIEITSRKLNRRVKKLICDFIDSV